MESRDLYNIDRQKIGVIDATEKVPLGSYVIGVLLILKNSEGKFLIQKRSESKGGLWAFTSGHPKSGENSLDGIITEVKEELGIELCDDDFIYLESNYDKDIIGDVFLVVKDIDINDIVLQKSEVSFVKYVSYDDIISLNAAGLFHKAHFRIFNDVSKYIL